MAFNPLCAGPVQIVDPQYTMTSSDGDIFRVTGPVWGVSTGHRIPVTKASDAKLWYFLWSAPEETVQQTIETPVIWDAIELIMTSLWWSITQPADFPAPIDARASAVTVMTESWTCFVSSFARIQLLCDGFTDRDFIHNGRWNSAKSCSAHTIQNYPQTSHMCHNI